MKITFVRTLTTFLILMSLLIAGILYADLTIFYHMGHGDAQVVLAYDRVSAFKGETVYCTGISIKPRDGNILKQYAYALGQYDAYHEAGYYFKLNDPFNGRMVSEVPKFQIGTIRAYCPAEPVRGGMHT